MHNFASTDAEGRLPGPIRDREARPLLSWRVRVLPYLEEEKLSRQFHLEEPWDSAHNLTLLEQMPKVFASFGAQPPQPHWTFYRLVTGPGTAFDRDGRTLKELENRAADSIVIVEAGESVPWTKPEEW